jgi:hypothetical protein
VADWADREPDLGVAGSRADSTVAKPVEERARARINTFLMTVDLDAMKERRVTPA